MKKAGPVPAGAAIAPERLPCYGDAMNPLTRLLTPGPRTARFWLCICLAEAGAIFILSIIPAGDGTVTSGMAAHALAYSTLSCSCGILLHIKKIPRGLAKAALLAALYGAGIELAQATIPYRTCEAADIAVNCCAALAGMTAAAMLRPLMDSGAKQKFCREP